MGFGNCLIDNLETFLSFTGFANATTGHWVMLAIGLLFIFLAIRYEFEPLLLIPIGFGMLIGNIPFKDAGLQIGIYEEGSVLNILYQGVRQGWYPPLIFLGIGAMTDFSALGRQRSLVSLGLICLLFFGALLPTKQGLLVSSVGQTGLRLSSFRPSSPLILWELLRYLLTPTWHWSPSFSPPSCAFLPQRRNA